MYYIYFNSGSAKQLRAIYFKMFGFSIRLYGFFIWLMYSSLLVAYLSISYSSLPFRNLEDVISKNTHQICIKDGTLPMIDMTYVDPLVSPQFLQICAYVLISKISCFYLKKIR